MTTMIQPVNVKPPTPLKAYEDIAFLKRAECRPVRLQLELLKPEVSMAEHGIVSTIVLFGSARIDSPEKAAQKLAEAQAAAASQPHCPAHQRAVAIAEKMLKLSSYYDLAREFAYLVSCNSRDHFNGEYVITTGGGGGIMEAGNRGAYDAGTKSIGLNISLPFEQFPNPYIPEDLNFEFHYFSIRKMHFLLRAKALAGFPGGFGTMDEIFETLTLIQTRKIVPIPIVLFGAEFWNSMINWDMLVDNGLICPQDLDIFHICETAEQGWQFIQDFWRQRPHQHPQQRPEQLG